MEITTEMIGAVATLRGFAEDSSRNSLNELSRDTADAIKLLDKTGVFANIDQAVFERENHA